MTTMLIMLVQAVMPAESPPPAVLPAIVAVPSRVRPPCEVSPDPDVITVCGKPHDDQFRLKPIPLPAGMKPPVDGPGVDFDIGKAHGNVYSTSVGRPDGLVDKRIMVTVKMPF